jgi:AcrR family transcriptional regulator
MGRVTPDAAGWQALRQWLEAYADLYEEYQPVFAAFAAAEGSDDVVASGAARVGGRQIKSVAAKIDPEAFKTDTPEVVAGILLNAVNRANRYEHLLVRIAPDRAPERGRLLDSLTDVLHRSLFGRRGVAMVAHRAGDAAPPRPPVPAATTEPPAEAVRLGPAGRRTRTKILDAGAVEFAANGYHDTRVDDIVAAAGVSHGTFYRYFDNKDHVFRVIAGRSGRRVFSALSRLPDIAEQPGSPASTRLLRKWMSDYSATWAEEGPIFRIWVEALGRDQELSDVTVRAMDAIRSTLARFLEPRGFGDTDMDAFLLLALLDLTTYGPQYTPGFEHSAGVVVTVIRRGFLGVDARFSKETKP